MERFEIDSQNVTETSGTRSNLKNKGDTYAYSREKGNANWTQRRTERSADASHANTRQIYGNRKRRRKPREKTRNRRGSGRNKTARRQHRRSRRIRQGTTSASKRERKQGQISTTIDQENKGRGDEKQHARYTKEWENKNDKRAKPQNEPEQSQKDTCPH